MNLFRFIMAFVLVHGMGSCSMLHAQSQIPGKTVKIGDKTNVNKDIIFDINNGVSNPRIRANDATNRLEFTNDGSLFKVLGSGSGGGSSGINLLSNPGFEDGATSSWTTSGGTYAEVTSGTNLLYQEKSATFDASASSQYFESEAITVPEILKGKSCSAYVHAKGGDGNLKLQVLNGSNVVLTQAGTNVEQIITANSGLAQRYGIGFTCPTSGSIKLRVTSTADATLQTFDQAYLGSAGEVEFTQAMIAGESYFTGQTSQVSAFTASTTVGENFNTAVDIAAPVIDFAHLGTWATTDADTYAQTITNLPPGIYEASFEANYYIASASGNCSNGITDGTNSKGWWFPTATGSGSAGPAVYKGTFIYTSTQSSVTFRPQVLACGSSSTVIYPGNSGSRVRFKLKYFPLASQKGIINALDADYDWTSYTPTFTNMGTPTQIECFHKREGSDLLVRCKWLMPASGASAAEARIGLPGSLVSADTTKIPTMQIAGPATDSAQNGRVFHTLMKPSVSYLMMGAKDATDLNSGFTTYFGTSLTASNLFNIYARVPIQGWNTVSGTYALNGMVASRYSGVTASEWITFGGATDATACTASPCTIHSQSGAFSSVVRTATGRYTININSGIFSATPTCVYSTATSGSPKSHSGKNGTESATVVYLAVNTPDGVSANDSSVMAICYGPR